MLSKTTRQVTSNNNEQKIAKKFLMKGIVCWMDGWLAAAVVKNFFVKMKNKDIYFIKRQLKINYIYTCLSIFL